jgi:GntR family transcriptional regulator, transcriptional repressor for pyruvate dehydrogenase complex
MTEDADARLRAFLIESELPPGARLPAERELAARLGVSRPALREATTRLAQWGVLRPVPKSGTYLAPLQIEDLLEVRLRVEPLAAFHAATRRSDEEVAELRDLHARLAKARREPRSFAAADLALHTAVARASRNVVLQEILRGLGDLGELTRARTATSPALRAATVDELGALVERVAGRDAAGAEAAMRRHLDAVLTTSRAEVGADKSGQTR